jgi:hypothetical protein
LVVLLILSGHAIIGMRMVIEWLMLLCRPFRVERWMVGPGELAARKSLFGVGWPRRWDPAELSHIALVETAKGWKQFLAVNWHGEGADWSLAFMNRAGAEMMRIDALTEGEGRWLGGAFCQLLKGSLKQPAFAQPAAESMYDPWLDECA